MVPRTKTLVLLGLPLLSVVVGLPAAHGQDTPATSPYYPLKVGTTWHYRLGPDKLTVKVTGEEKVGEFPCARIEATLKGTKNSEDILVKADGVYRVKSQDKEIKPALCLLPLPPAKGKTWTVDAEVDGVKIKGSFAVDEEEVTVPAGKFKALKVTSKDYVIGTRAMALTYWFAEGKGLVKQRLEMDGFDLILELEQFDAGQ